MYHNSNWINNLLYHWSVAVTYHQSTSVSCIGVSLYLITIQTENEVNNMSYMNWLTENKVNSRPDDHQCWGACGTCTAMHGLVASSISVFTAHKLAMNTCSYSPVVCKWCWHYCEHFHMCWQQRTNQVGYSTGGQRFMAVVNKPRLWATSLDSVCLLPGTVLQLN